MVFCSKRATRPVRKPLRCRSCSTSASNAALARPHSRALRACASASASLARASASSASLPASSSSRLAAKSSSSSALRARRSSGVCAAEFVVSFGGPAQAPACTWASASRFARVRTASSSSRAIVFRSKRATRTERNSFLRSISSTAGPAPELLGQVERAPRGGGAKRASSSSRCLLASVSSRTATWPSKSLTWRASSSADCAGTARLQRNAGAPKAMPLPTPRKPPVPSPGTRGANAPACCRCIM
mmetsp:Transcript_13407/g.37065  ORF Transcript_13407/g.37065 Transcript_13407/m.37065 type:complete len:246 (+) Transcript_13407:781-1518(+)